MLPGLCQKLTYFSSQHRIFVIMFNNINLELQLTASVLCKVRVIYSHQKRKYG